MTRVSLTPAPSEAGMPRSVWMTARGTVETGVAALMVGPNWWRLEVFSSPRPTPRSTRGPRADALDLIGSEAERMQEVRMRFRHVLLEVRVPLAHFVIRHAEG